MIEKLAANWETILAILGFVVAILKAMKAEAGKQTAEGQVSTYKKTTAILSAGVEALAENLPNAKAKETKAQIKALATEAGVEGALSQVVRQVTKGAERVVDFDGKIVPSVVKKATSPERPAVAVDAMGAPIGPGPRFGALLALTFSLALLAGPATGCVARESKETAKRLYVSADRLWRGSTPRGTDRADQRAYWLEWTAFRETARELVLSMGEELPPLEGEEAGR